MKRISNLLPIALLCGVALTGCKAPDGTEVAASTAALGEKMGEQSPNETEKDAPKKQPAPGKANVIGQVVHQGKGVANIEVQMCKEAIMSDGCTGQFARAKTDANGYYILDNVSPGEYGIAVRLFDSKRFVRPITGIAGVSKFKLKAGETLKIRKANLWKTDLKPRSPVAGAMISTPTPTLSWAVYPEATSYKVRVSALRGGISTPQMETDQTLVKLDRALPNGEYHWKVDAYSSENIKIASMADYSEFKIIGQKGSNFIEILEPVNQGVVGGAELMLRWEPNALADEYRVYLKGASQQKAVLRRKSLTGTSLKVEQILAPDRYLWSVSAYKEGFKIASGGLQYFTVN